ncbi:MAG: hypothetical protein H6741_10340 [Alphaproteobacteria bacterium]|nr:hypothetical protein [Alphaproteobacteria bacterium]MCB9793113.1 hypothetical protein [Alphaproteobacteria bacterium]
MRALFLACLVAAACKKPPPEPPDYSDGPAGGSTTTTGTSTGRAPTPEAPSRAFPSSGGIVGASVDDVSLLPVLGSYRDAGGHLLRIDNAERGLYDGKEVALYTRWCGREAQTLICTQLEATPGQGGGWLTLVAEPEGALRESVIGEGYTVSGPVQGGQRFSVLAAPPDPDALPADRRLQLGPDGQPLFCTEAGEIKSSCDGHYYRIPLLPVHSRLVEERQIVLVGPTAPQACNPGIRVDQELGPVDRVDLGRLATPVEPREDYVLKIARITGIKDPQFALAAWVDLDKDRREELIFELNAPADESGRPGYSVVGWLDGRTQEPVLLEVHHGVSPQEPPLRHRLAGLVDVRGDGHLGVLVDVEGTSWVIWAKTEGDPRRAGVGGCL